MVAWLSCALLLPVIGPLLGMAPPFVMWPRRRAVAGGMSPTPPQPALILNGAELANGEGRLRSGEFLAVSRSIDELAFTIETGSVRVYETVSGWDLEDFSFVQIISFTNPTGTLLNAVAAYLLHRGVDAVNMEDIGAPTRLLQYVRFAQAGIPVPAARYLPAHLLEAAYPDLADQLGIPFILTALRGGGCRQDFLITDESSFAARLRARGQTRTIFLAREFIPADVSYHLLVMGGQVPIVIRKPLSLDQTRPPGNPPEEHVALTDPATLDALARRLATQAASLMGYDVASIEMARHCTTGEWYVLKTNATPPISSGAFAPEKLSAYISYLERKLHATNLEKDYGSRSIARWTARHQSP
jgi:glutathione synthase/RimK-type ligase-like ATP-grasp enzyme